MEWLCWVFGILLVITLLGHGIWVAIAVILRSARTKTQPAQDAGSAEPSWLVMESQLRQLLEAGLIDLATYHRVRVGITVIRRKPGEGDTIAPPQSAPSPEATPPAVELIPALPLDVANQVIALPEIQPESKSIEPIPEPVPVEQSVKPVAPPRPPRRPFSEVFAAFLRDSNIRWGELVGGLLIIGCSVALVISFWGQIAAKPFFQFGLFTSITTAALGLGLHAEHRWKLPTTSRGILLIATMLVPLNFLALAALSHGTRPSPIVMAGEEAALALFAFLIWHAARVITPYWPYPLTQGIVMLSGSLLVIQYFNQPGNSVRLLMLSPLPVGLYAGTIFLMLEHGRRWKRIRLRKAEFIFVVLGVLSFAAALPLGLLILSSPAPFRAAHDLSVLLSLSAAPALATGLLLWQRITSRRAAKHRATGTAIAVAAALLMLGCLALAWPDPRTLLPLAAADLIVFALIAIRLDSPIAYAPAMPCLVIVYLLTIEQLRGHVGWISSTAQLLHTLSAATTGPTLLPLFAILAAAALLLGNGRARVMPSRSPLEKPGSADFGEHSQPGVSPSQMLPVTEASILAWTAAGIAVINLVQTAWHGFGVVGDPHAGVWIFLAYAAAALLLARNFRLQAAGWIGCTLLAAALAQFFLTRTSVLMPWPTALLSYATLALAGTIVRRRDAGKADALLLPARWTAMLATASAAALLLTALSVAGLTPIATRAAWISVLCLAMSIADSSEPLFIVGQIAASLAAVLFVLARLSIRPWFVASADPLRDPWSLQAIGAAVACVALLTTIVRRILPRRFAVANWLEREYAFDRLAALLLAAGFAALAVGAIAPGLGWELSPPSPSHPSAIWSIHAAGRGSWLVLALLLCTFTLQLRGQWLRIAYPVTLTLGAFACLLWAARWSDQNAAASAARWALTLLLLAGSIPIWLRRRLPPTFQPIALESRALLVVWSALPILAVSLYTTGVILQGAAPVWPDAQCFFGRIGSSVSYLVPLIVVTVVFLLNAVLERSAGWAVSASAACNLAVTLAYTLPLATRNAPAGADDAIRLIQLNAITLAVFALFWLAFGRFTHTTKLPALLRIEIQIAIVANAVLLTSAALWISLWPEAPSHLAAVGGATGWAALVATVAAIVGFRRFRADRFSPATIVISLFSVGILLACFIAGRGVHRWMDYHVLMAAAVIASGINLAAGAWIGRLRRGWAQPMADSSAAPSALPAVAPIELQYARHDDTGGPLVAAVYVGGEPLQPAVLRWTAMANALAVLLSIRAMAGDPLRPWWSAGITATIALLWAAIACWLLAPRLLYAGGLLLNLATTFWFFIKVAPISAAPGFDASLADIAVLSVSGLAALVLHLNVFREGMQPPTRAARLPFHRFAAFVALMGLIAVVSLTIASDVTQVGFSLSALMSWGAIAAAFVLVMALLWDPDAPYVVAEMYAIGSLAAAAGLHQFHYFHQPIEVAGAVAMGGYVLLSGLLYSIRDMLMRIAASLGTPKLRRDETAGWLAPAGIVLLAATLAMAFRCDFAFVQHSLRLWPASAAFMGLFGLLFISRSDRRLDLRYVILGLLPICGAASAWGWMSPRSADALLRAVVLLAVLGLSLLAFSWVAFGQARSSLWATAARGAIRPMAVAWALGMAAVLCIEIATALSGGSVSLAGWGSAIVMASLILATTACVVMALVPAVDAFKLPAKRRGSYVYLAETMLGLGLAHLRLTEPWLFGGALSQYWPLLIMGLAFGGVALAELFGRRGTVALSSPLFRTGTFLPLLPVIAFWASPSRVNLSTLLLAVGVFYAILSAARRSFGFGVLAALAANGALWSLLARQPSLAFIVHPQIWLIPAAASVLIAAQLNRDRLAPAQMRFVRYCCLMVVYVSSTADIFLNGVTDHPWLPLVLAVLSVAGVMFGIFFRLRAFLLLGTLFLALAMITMIYYASADLHWTWLWYVAGIALGVSILVLFALFEKKRTEMLALVDGLKRWE